MIAPLEPGQAARVAALDAELFAGNAWSPDAWERAAGTADPDRRYVVALGDGGLLGYAGILRVGSDAEVLTVAVAAAHRREGVGAQLLDALLGIARGWRALAVFLEVEQDNAAAIALYRGRGFTELGRRRGYYGAGRDALTMRRQLREPLGSVLLDGAP